MTVESNIPIIDREGSAGKVLTDYQVHTISIVGKGALGINLTKLKSVSLKETEEGKALKEKLDKAKSLDAAEAVVEEVTTEEAVVEELPVEEVVVEEVVAEAAVEAPVEAVVEETEEVAVVVAEQEEVAVEEQPEVLVVEEAGTETVAAKMLTVEEHVESSKVALDAISKMVIDIKAKAPDADAWEVFSIINGICWDIEDAMWYEDCAKWDAIWQQVWDETNSRVEKSKELKVSGEQSFEDKCKSLELVDPALAEFARTERAKSIKLESELKATVRAKALEKGASEYKRISTEENPTDAIVDAMLHIEQLAPEQHTVIAKALAVAANITMAGDLFRDTGSTEGSLNLSPEEYVDTKAKALVEAKGGDSDDKSALAAARASVRQTAEFTAIYG
jgi:hypothetical protein